MCGIFACIHGKCSRRQRKCPKLEILERLRRRGPDHMREVTIPTISSALGDSTSLDVVLIGTLLSMRGEATPQPLCNGDGDQFLWNGNIFGGQIEVGPLENDTVKLFLELNKQVDDSGILFTLNKVHGPWSFVLWQHSEQCLWFGRDVFGRRSLLWHLPSSWEDRCLFSLCSVAHYHPSDMPLDYWREVPAAAVYKLQLTQQGPISLVCYPWMQGGICFQSESGILEELSMLRTCLKAEVVNNEALQVPFPPLNKQLPELPPQTATSSDSTSRPFETVTLQASLGSNKSAAVATPPGDGISAEVKWSVLAQQLLTVLQRAIEKRVCRAPHIKSLKGHTSEETSSKHPEQSTLVPCDPMVCAVLTPQDKDEFPVEHEHKRNETTKNCIESVVSSKQETAVPAQRTPIDKDPASCIRTEQDICSASASSNTYQGDVMVGKARVAVLFSGGVDSVVMAALTDRCLDPTEEIDLINVAFEQKTNGGRERNFEVPDRVSSIQSLRELNPLRKWNLVLVNVTLREVNEMRKRRISQLVYPLCTVLDDSIGCALWFGARGVGLLYSETASHTQYQSQARTLFVGIGADEQLAGYSRHRTRFRSGGWGALVEEVEMDIKRLARRNLGRDDRCIADHEREGQFPFLDEEVVTFLQQQPIWSKADLNLPRGIGEKRLLREVSALLGCHTAAALPKRAIQFGSRMAKLSGSSNSRKHGSDVCERLLPSQ